MHWCRFIVVLPLLAGCGSHPNEQASPASVPQPAYGLGDAYRFSDGSRESVVAVEGDIIRWRGNDGTYITSRDILLPRLAWADAGGQGQRSIRGPVALFPLQPGKAVKFTATRSLQPAAAQQPVVVREDWLCEVAGKQQVTTTPAGGFDTWRVNCRMRETPAVTGSGVIERSFDYAPKVGFYVRVEDKVGDGPLHVAQLTGYTGGNPVLPDSARRQRSAELQQTLEREPSGTPTTWSDAATGTAGDVVVLDTRQSDRFGWCRDFAEQIQSAGRSYSLRGTGCRNPANAWDIMALAPSAGGLAGDAD